MNRRGLLGLFALWATVSGAALVAPGCYGRNCEGRADVFGREPGEGSLIDEDTWQSSPMDGKWLPFPRQQLYFFELRELGDRTPAVVVPYVSPVEEPARSFNATIGGGNLTELSGIAPGRVAVKNGTCADYYLRVVVMAPPRPPDAGLLAPDVDAGVEEEPPEDAGSDAPTDAGDEDAEAGT